MLWYVGGKKHVQQERKKSNKCIMSPPFGWQGLATAARRPAPYAEY